MGVRNDILDPFCNATGVPGEDPANRIRAAEQGARA